MSSIRSRILIPTLVALTGFYACDSGEEPPDEPLLIFEKSTQEFSPASTFQIALGDLDSDGDPDAALANMGLDGSQVMFNDGSGYFVDSGQQLTPDGHGIEIADLDGDGNPDLFFACANYQEASKVYFNDSHGAFQDSCFELDDSTLSGNDVTLFDADGDGDLDVSIIYYEAPDRLYINDGHGHFTYDGQILPEHATIVDVDSDGDNDLFIKEFGQGYKTMLNDGTGNFTDYWQVSDQNVIYGQVAFGDFDHDGDQDAFVANGDNTDSYPSKIMLNDGTGRFTDSGQELRVTQWAHLLLGDLNGDGYLDALMSNFGLLNEIWLGDGTGHFTDSELRPGDHINARGSALGDFDGDGDLDIFMATFVEGPNEVWFNETD